MSRCFNVKASAEVERRLLVDKKYNAKILLSDGNGNMAVGHVAAIVYILINR